MTWLNKNNEKYIYMLNLDMLGHLDTFFVDKYQGMVLGLSKTNKAATVSVDMSIAIITINTPKGLYYYHPNIDIQYINEITKQFAFISKDFTNQKKLVTNDKQLMMRILKKIIKRKITRIEHLRKDTIIQGSTLTDTYLILYDNTIEKLYQIYNTLNEKIKSL